MTAMLLLKLAGVDDETIIGDYACSEKTMADIFPLQVEQMEASGRLFNTAWINGRTAKRSQK